ncbi:MAG: alpha/beta hydrolase fold protein [uncultured bacterium]|nr:MAG: alpha/beta hydrolase fold protein [uncultured bacterium]
MITTSHFFANGGARIHVEISVQGSPIVMLHGWTSSHQEWRPFLGALTPKHRVYHWDARGHGCPTHNNHSKPTVERIARDLANLLEHYQLEKVTAVGHSMGVLTLWQYIRDSALDDWKSSASLINCQNSSLTKPGITVFTVSSTKPRPMK